MFDTTKAVVRIGIEKNNLRRDGGKYYIKRITTPILKEVKKITGQNLLLTCHIKGEIFSLGYELKYLNGIEVCFEMIYYPDEFTSKEAWENAVEEFYQQLASKVTIPVTLELIPVRFTSVI